MLLGDPDYFVADIDCSFSLHPYMNGKPAPPQLSQKTIDDAMETNPFRARREYYNIFDSDESANTFIKRSVINKNSQPYFPVFENEDGKKKYIIAYDPAAKLDNSIIMVGELFRDKERGLMVKLVNCVNLIEVLKNGEKRIIQAPEQIDMLKNILLAYNKGADDYENIQRLKIDAGSGGGGFQVAQFLLKDWKGEDGKYHTGVIDIEDTYMSLRQDDFPQANQKVLRMANFKKDKTNMYDAAQNMANQGLIIFPEDMNARNELLFTETDAEGVITTRYEKANYDEMNALNQFSLLKEEITGMQKVKKPSGNIVYEQTVEAKQSGKHDDRVDAFVMIASELAQLRAEENLQIAEAPKSAYKDMLARIQAQNNKKTGANPFGNLGANPFSGSKRPSIF